MDAKTIVKKVVSLTAAASGSVGGICLLSNKKAGKAQKVIGGVSLATGAAVAGMEIVPPLVAKIKGCKKNKLDVKPAEAAATV